MRQSVRPFGEVIMGRGDQSLYDDKGAGIAYARHAMRAVRSAGDADVAWASVSARLSLGAVEGPRCQSLAAHRSSRAVKLSTAQ